MPEYSHVEKPFLDQLAALGWTVIDQGQGFIPSDPAASRRGSFREWLLPEVFQCIEQSALAKRLVDDDGDAAFTRQRQQALLGFAGRPGCR